MYVDGKPQYAANLNIFDVQSTIVIPNSFKAIAIECSNNGSDEGLLASAKNFLGELVLLSDTTWKCSEVFEQGWEQENFDSSSENWKSAIDLGPKSLAVIGQISSYATWIGTGKSLDTIYCRAEMPWKRGYTCIPFLIIC